MIIKEDWSDGVKKLIIIDYIYIYLEKFYKVYMAIVQVRSWRSAQSIKRLITVLAVIAI